MRPLQVWFLASFLLGWGLVGCANNFPLAIERTILAQQIAQSSKMQMQIIQTDQFSLMAFTKNMPGQVATTSNTLTIYLEGDGHAWSNRYTISGDPTPLDPIGLKLASHDPSNQLAYLARPCQFVMTIHYEQGCNQKLWSSQRFSSAVIHATNQAIDILKEQFHASRLVLIGYSGGAALALLCATQRRDVGQIITVAGNLDTAQWTKSLGLSPLDGSLNPADSAHSLQNIAQAHFIGEEDAVMPKEIIWSYLKNLPNQQSNTVVIEMPGYSHACCWAQNWAALLGAVVSR